VPWPSTSERARRAQWIGTAPRRGSTAKRAIGPVDPNPAGGPTGPSRTARLRSRSESGDPVPCWPSTRGGAGSARGCGATPRAASTPKRPWALVPGARPARGGAYTVNVRRDESRQVETDETDETRCTRCTR
jgi:hypothetical protein